MSLILKDKRDILKNEMYNIIVSYSYFFLFSLLWVLSAFFLCQEKTAFNKERFYLIKNTSGNNYSASYKCTFLRRSIFLSIHTWKIKIKRLEKVNNLFEAVHGKSSVIRYDHHAFREYFCRNQWKLGHWRIAHLLHHVWLKLKNLKKKISCIHHQFAQRLRNRVHF